VHKDANQATEFIQQLAKVYRYVLQNQEKELVDVGSELAFMEAYVYLLRTRFHENLHISIDVPVHLLQCYTVPVALQMVVENALKHNIGSKNRPLRIQVFAEADQQLVVRNNLQLRPVVEPSTNLGLKNIMRRYGFVSERPVEVVRDDTSFSVKLPLLREDF
jgi:LytS/YehU family sensor histidine kinase